MRTAPADSAFRAFLASCIESSREVTLKKEDLASTRTFRGKAWRLSKSLGLTRSCIAVERNLYKSRP